VKKYKGIYPAVSSRDREWTCKCDTTALPTVSQSKPSTVSDLSINTTAVVD